MSTTIDQIDDGIRFPGDVRIDDIVLVSHTTQGIGLMNIFVELNLYEDIYSNTLSGDVTIVDSSNLPMNAPLTGLEKIYFSFYTPGQNSSKIELLMNVYKIGEPIIENDKTQMYTLYFCSPEQMRDGYKKLCQAFDGFQYEFVGNILKDENALKSERDVELEPTKFETTCIIPNWNPFKAINWIASRSVSDESLLPDMMFFETVDGFKFRSINSLMKEEIKENYFYRVYGHNDLDNPDRHNYPNLPSDHVNINNLAIKPLKDTITLSQNGTFAQKLVSFDIINGEYKIHEFNYIDEYNKIQEHLSEGKLIPNTETLDHIKLQEEYNSYVTIVPNHSNLFSNRNIVDFKRYSDWLPMRQSLLQQYNSTILQFTVPGDTTRRVGDVVEMFIPSFEAFEEDQYVPDKYLSGKYMISSIRHQIKRDNHQMIVEVFKDGFGTPLPDTFNE